MRPSKKLLLALLAVALVAGAGVAGYLLGSGDSSTPEDAASAGRTARDSAEASAEESSFDRARERGSIKGFEVGNRSGGHEGSRDGATAGEARATSILAEREAAAAEAAAPPPLAYTDELPNGQPGYVLPPDQSSLGCVGIDAASGQCVGD